MKKVYKNKEYSVIINCTTELKNKNNNYIDIEIYKNNSLFGCHSTSASKKKNIKKVCKEFLNNIANYYLIGKAKKEIKIIIKNI